MRKGSDVDVVFTSTLPDWAWLPGTARNCQRLGQWLTDRLPQLPKRWPTPRPTTTSVCFRFQCSFSVKYRVASEQTS